ncbi:flagellin N-terminal helical domain-containing protein [Hungatella hathewayi]|uniref:flagellin N-terminal helical domain-containing protein n=1 Tax=Hungatella hathewayi TaxID=154046 RepID=UPI003563C61E
MRVTNTATYRNYITSVNDVQQRMNKSMNRVSSGKAYENAADSPLSYYQGKKIDNQYQDVLTKLSLITNVKGRLSQSETAALSIQKTLSGAKNKVQSALSDTNSGNNDTLKTIRDDLLQKQQSMVNDLNAQYQDTYVFGGNDTKSAPFSLSADGKTLTFSHQFPGQSTTTQIEMTLQKKTDGSGEYEYKIDDADLELIKKAMKEQGKVDIGHGTISDRDSLLDTFSGGLNLLTGLTSDAVRTGVSDQEIRDRMNNSPIALLGQAAAAIDDYIDTGDSETYDKVMRKTLDSMTDTEHTVSTVYADLGNRSALLDSTEAKLKTSKDDLTEQYKDLLGADPYEAIMNMYSDQSSYSAALRVGSQMMQSSLFDFMR